MCFNLLRKGERNFRLSSHQKLSASPTFDNTLLQKMQQPAIISFPFAKYAKHHRLFR
jgi:hypothetical protein